MRKIYLIASIMVCSTSPAWSGPLAQLQGPPAGGQESRLAATESKPPSCEALAPADGTKLGIIRQMLAAGKPHAALAYLDAAHIDSPQSDLVRADGLRQTGRDASATELYRKLLDSCVAGNAYQGLGLIAGQEGDVIEAVDQLHSASVLLHIDPAIRNDYGYALLLAGEDEAALHEFLTAIELSPGNRQAAHNLLLLLYRTGENEKADKFAEQFGIDAAESARLKTQSQKALPGIALNDAATTHAVTEPAQPGIAEKEQ
jgi:Flp pilus assembly protein TadD